jgi:hypothetical protein
MKNAMKTLIATLALILIGSTFVAKASSITGQTTLKDIKKVNTIHVAGNVSLILVQSFDESVKVYNEYYANNALVQQNDNDLRISSFEKAPLTVVVYVSNLTEISASGNATVKTYGNFSLLSLVVNLKDSATANLKTNTIDLYTNLSGQATLTLSGSTTSYGSVMDSFSTVNMEQFAAESSNIKSKTSPIAAKINKKELYIMAQSLSK